MIKPKTALSNKNEFNVVFEPQVDPDKADMSKIEKPLLKNLDEEVGNAKMQIIDEKRKEIDALKKELN